MNIFLDDVRNLDDMTYMNNASIYFQNKFEVVRNVAEFKNVLDNSKEMIEIISFDHDLLPNHYGNLKETANNPIGTGQEALLYFINWINRNSIKYEIKIMIHTMNYHGLQAMVNLLSRNSLKKNNINLIQRTPSIYLAR